LNLTSLRLGLRDFGRKVFAITSSQFAWVVAVARARADGGVRFGIIADQITSPGFTMNDGISTASVDVHGPWRTSGSASAMSESDAVTRYPGGVRATQHVVAMMPFMVVAFG
jgi:hypothetical protein